MPGSNLWGLIARVGGLAVTINGVTIMKFTVIWTCVGSHGYHEVIASTAHEALAIVTRLLAGGLTTKARFEVHEGTPFRGSSYCMSKMTFID